MDTARQAKRAFSTILSYTDGLRLPALIVALLVGAPYIPHKILAPEKGTVNGTYHNDCCGDVVMRDGVFYYRGAIYKYDLESMKFGLIAYVPGNFTAHGVDSSAEQTALLFFTKNGRRRFETRINQQDYTFLQIK